MKSSLRNMVLSLGGIAIGVAALLGAVHSLTARPIAEAAAAQAREAVAEVLPPFDNDPMATAVDIDGCEVYPATMQGAPAGAAVRVTTMDGFSGRIVVMAGFDAGGTLTGYRVLEQAETPGLGAQADEWFRTAPHTVLGTSSELIVSKDAAPSSAGGDAHSGASYQQADDDDAHSGASHRHSSPATEAVDGITAATITSRAFLGAINRARRAYQQYQKSCKR
ncbi:MAG: RnfABCDGE type electron transport complex subunit G [Bacteroides sp.]|nr:RnfABCDGE type electron transport complex subunit G [Bacteroides sp.]MCM1095357.1 RnfABCDGE type electron transport complex subunit G [Terasakiella sp.]